jgi:hypothetical protein
VKDQRRALASLFLGKASPCLFRRRLGRLESHTEHFKEEKTSCPFWEKKHDFSVVQPITISTELYIRFMFLRKRVFVCGKWMKLA